MSDADEGLCVCGVSEGLGSRTFWSLIILSLLLGLQGKMPLLVLPDGTPLPESQVGAGWGRQCGGRGIRAV